MKKSFFPFVALFTLFTIASQLSYGQANTSLSNLASPTSVNVSLLPKNNNTQNLGSANKSWRSLFLDSSIFLRDSLFIHNEGTRNIFIGEATGTALSTGNSNTALGSYSLNKNTSGSINTAMGALSLAYNTTGYSNSAFGYLSLSANSIGFSNAAVGSFALSKNISGSSNSALGESSLANNTSGNNNTAVGFNALYYDSSGSENTAAGYSALSLVTSGFQNTGVGVNSLQSIANGYHNAALGYNAGYLHKGNNNTYLGAYTYSNLTVTNSTAIGYDAHLTASNQVRIGNSTVTSIGGQVSWSTLSDGRVKKNIKENVPGLAFINKLNPVTYNLDLNAYDAISNPQTLKDSKGNISAPSKEQVAAREEKEKVVYTGLIAQDVEKTAKELGYDFSGVDASKNDKDLYGIRYTDFVMPLIKAVQELSKQTEEQQKEIDELKAMVIGKINQTSAISKQQKISLSQTAKLDQNLPNPTAQSTTIKYFIPEQTIKAVVKINNANGQEIKSINLSQKNNAQINLQTNDLISGTYFYSLIIDGKIIDTKKMIIAH